MGTALVGLTRYGGNYTDYQSTKRAERERWQRRFTEEQEELAKLRRSVEVTAHEVAPGRAAATTTKRWATDTPTVGYRPNLTAGAQRRPPPQRAGT
ncbi:hypothetical protein [Micromonospora zamorensis]|uniref:hypothetical protein n=1 Tax=Micromonospora zamorensis TaxID=709883 RepID=UPI003CEEDCD7